MPTNDCPGPDELKQYVHGTCPPKSVQGLEMHVATCTSCEETLRGLDDSADLFLDSLRRDLSVDEQRFLNEPAYHAAATAAAQLSLDLAADSSNLDSEFPQDESSPRTDPDLPFSRLGQYELISEIGRGGMGVVYKARHAKLDRIVALKVLPAEKLSDTQALERFEREMKAVGRLQHNNIVQAFDADEIDTVHYLAMEYVDGVNLSDLLKQHGPLPIAEACELIRQAAVGLQHAFEFGLVHRDIKPGNVMLTQQGQVKLLDLGLALLQGNHFPESGDLTAPGQLMGTIDYMAPEQAESTHNVDIRADIYSLGATLYALLTGAAPFAGEQYGSFLKKMVALANETAAPIHDQRADVPNELAVVIHRMLSRQPSERFSTPAEVAIALEPFVVNANLAELLQSAGEGNADKSASSFVDTVQASANATGDTSVTRDPAVQPTRISCKELPGESSTQPTVLTSVAVHRPWQRSRVVVGIGIVGLLALLAVIVISVRTPAGTIVLEMSQSEIAGAQVTIDDGAVLTIRTGKGKETIKVAADKQRHLLKVTKGGFETFTQEFTVKASGKQSIRVRLEPLKALITDKPRPTVTTKPDPKTLLPPILDPHRRAAEMVLRRGGGVGISTSTGQTSIGRLDQLPQRRFAIVNLSLRSVGSLSDEDWKALEGIKYLDNFYSFGTPISEAGLRTLTQIGSIQSLRLDGSELSEVGQLSKLTELRRLLLNNNFSITDTSCSGLAKLTELRELDIAGTGITGTGLQELAALPNLYSLRLHLGRGIPAADLAHLSSFQSLRRLHIYGHSVEEEAVQQLGKLTFLRVITLGETDVSDKGAARLQRMLPDCSIIHPSLPTAEADKSAAQWAIDNGGNVTGNWLSHSTKLPQEPFILTGIGLYGNRASVMNSAHLDGLHGLESLGWSKLANADGELSAIGKLTTLRTLSFSESDLSAAGLERLSALTQLETLALNHCKNISDNGCAHLTAFKHLRDLAFGASSITDKGFVHIGKLPRVHHLSFIACKKITGSGLKHLVRLPGLRILSLSETPLTDDAVVYLQQMTSLRILSVNHTKLTPALAAKLQAALPDCVVFHESLEDVP